MKKRMAIPALAGALLMGGVALAANAGPSLAATTKGLLSMEEAKAIAVKSVGGEVTKIELDHEKSGDVYEIELQSDGVEYDLEIHAKTGKVLYTEKEDMDHDEHITSSSENFITQEAAVEIAMKQAKGTVTEVELDDEDGRVIYEIEMKDGTYEYDFDIDATSGEVLKFKKERDDD